MVHCDAEAFFFRDDEVDKVLKVCHLPNFDDSVAARAANQVVLVELVRVACRLLLWRKLVWCHVLEV